MSAAAGLIETFGRTWCAQAVDVGRMWLGCKDDNTQFSKVEVEMIVVLEVAGVGAEDLADALTEE